MKFDIKNYLKDMPEDYDGYHVHPRNGRTYFLTRAHISGKLLCVPMSDGVDLCMLTIDDYRRPLEIMLDDVVMDDEYIIFPYRRVRSKRKKTNGKNA